MSNDKTYASRWPVLLPASSVSKASSISPSLANAVAAKIFTISLSSPKSSSSPSISTHRSLSSSNVASLSSSLSFGPGETDSKYLARVAIALSAREVDGDTSGLAFCAEERREGT